MTDVLDTQEAGPAAIRGGAIRITGYAAGVLLSVGSAALLFRHLGVVDGGRYVLVTSVATIAVGLTEAGLSTLGVRELAQRPASDRTALLRNLLGLRLLLSCAGIVVACGYAAAIGYGDRLVVGVALAGIALLLQGTQTVLTVALQAELRLWAVTLADLVRQVTGVLGIVVLVLVGAGLLPFLGALVVAGASGVAAAILLLRGAAPLRPGFDTAFWRNLLALTLPFALASAIGTIYLRLGMVLIDRIADARETGLYALSFRIVEVAVQVPALAVGATLPILARAARDDADRLRYAVQRTLETSMTLGAFAAAGLVSGAPAIVAVVGGAEYAEAAAVLRWHALALAASFAYQPYAFALLSMGRTRAVLGTSLLALTVSAVATVTLASSLGAEGAAAAAALAECCLSLACAVLLPRHGGPRLSYAFLLRLLIVSGAGLAPALVLPAVPAALVGALAFVAVAWILGLIPPELREVLLRRAR